MKRVVSRESEQLGTKEPENHVSWPSVVWETLCLQILPKSQRTIWTANIWDQDFLVVQEYLVDQEYLVTQEYQKHGEPCDISVSIIISYS